MYNNGYSVDGIWHKLNKAFVNKLLHINLTYTQIKNVSVYYTFLVSSRVK